MAGRLDYSSRAHTWEVPVTRPRVPLIVDYPAVFEVHGWAAY